MDKQAREAREMTKSLPFKERAKNFWFYNKWYVVGVVFVVLLLSFTLYECATQEQYDLQIFYISETAISDETVTKMEEYFSQFVEDINGDGVANVLVSAMSANPDLSPEQAYAAQTKLMADLSSGESMAFLADGWYYDMFTGESMDGVVESSVGLNTIPQLKEMFGYQEEQLYFITKVLYEREMDEPEKQAEHDNAKRVEAGLQAAAAEQQVQ